MTRIEYLVAHPYEVEKSDIPLLKKEVEKYPYFYTLRALLLYGLKKENHPSFEDYLNKTSIHSSNRVDLYHYLNSEKIEKKDNFKNDTNLDETPSFEEKIQEESISVINEVKEEVIEEFTPTVIEEEKQEEVEVIDNSISDVLQQENDRIVEIENVEETIEPIQEIKEVPVEQENNLEDDILNALQQTSEIEVEEEKNIVNDPIIKEEETIVEEIKAENIDSDSTHSFSDWLKRFPSQQKDQKTLEEEQEIAEREIKYKLIDDFLEKNPKIVPMKKVDIPSPNTTSNFGKNSEEYSDLMTETLAQIYIEQKKYDKAIKAYKILILKYPEKNGLFANRIKEIENLTNSK